MVEVVINTCHTLSEWALEHEQMTLSTISMNLCPGASQKEKNLFKYRVMESYHIV